VHLILCLGDTLDWDRIMRRAEPHWQLLLAQVLTFHYVYPAYASNVPPHVTERLLELANTLRQPQTDEPDFTRGPLISRFSFMIDVREWGFADLRTELVRAARNHPDIRAIAEADVWDERGEDRAEAREERVGA
jgi:hypothetical protein